MNVILIVAATLMAPPNSLQLQGTLTSAGGTAVDGTYSLQIALYDGPTDGAVLWSDNFPTVTVTSGIFQLALMNVAPNLVENPVWLSVKVEGEPELPRRPLLPTASALVASRALMATDLQCTGCVQHSEVAPCADGEILKMSGGAWTCAPEQTVSAGPGLIENNGALALDTAGCSDGWVLKRTPTGWTCGPSTKLSVYQRTCTAAACSVACDTGDLIVSCDAATDPNDEADDTDVAANLGTGTCSKGSNDPEYTLRVICLSIDG